MTKSERRRFLRELIRNVKADLIVSSDRAPDTWDGFELRWLAADHFNRATVIARSGYLMPRKRAYNKEVLVRNL